MSKILDLTDMATSYGVEIPGTDGKAGMVSIPAKSEADVDLSKLYDGVKKELPKYARPLFVRITREIQMTGITFITACQNRGGVIKNGQ